MDLEKELAAILDDYSEEVNQTVKEVASESAKRAANELKQTSPRRRPRYYKGWKATPKSLITGRVEYVVHNAKDYRLAHLLEFGHVLRNGGRTKAIPHIKPVEEKYTDEFYRDTIKKIKAIK
jgi:hypothetical protein